LELTINLKIGQIVKSKKGRDKNRVFVISRILDERYVLICDGDLRKLNTPKKKKVKHLMIYNTVLTEFAEKLKSNENLDDAFLRRILEPFAQNSKNVSEEMEVE
jgi:ribosomal protein L14E/L6E/L27E